MQGVTLMTLSFGDAQWNNIFYKIHNNSSHLLPIPLPEERYDLVKRIHRDMGHFGVRPVMDRLKLNYWWKGTDETVNQVVSACMLCARTKAGFQVSGLSLIRK